MAKLTGTSHDTIHKASKIIDFATEETKQKYRVFYGDFYEKDCLDGWVPNTGSTETE